MEQEDEKEKCYNLKRNDYDKAYFLVFNKSDRIAHTFFILVNVASQISKMSTSFT